MRQFWMMLAGVVFAGAAMAAEKDQFATDQSVFTTPTAPAMGGFGADADALTSMKGTGKVKIGGDVIVKYVYSRLQLPTNTGPQKFDGSGTFNASEWEADTADLNFQIDACEGGKLFISLDLTDPWYNARTEGYTQDDILQEIYFTLENICGTGFGVTFGKTEIPFGYNYDVLALHPYINGYGETFISTSRNGSDSWDYTGETIGHSWQYDNRFALIPFFKLNDTLKIEAAMFQDSTAFNGDRNYNGRWNGTYNTRTKAWDPAGRQTNDPGFSFAGRATWTPIEDLMIMGSVVTRYNSNADDVNGWTNRMIASSAAFDYKPCFFGKKFGVFGEWQHAWNPEFESDTSSDDIHVGLSYDLTEALTLYAQYEWLRMRNKRHNNDYYEQFNRAIVAGQYAFASGMYVELGYQREWYKSSDRSGGSAYGSYAAHADVIYSAFGWAF